MAGTVNVVVFSNFEGFDFAPGPALSWFEVLGAAHPEVRWTHLHNPRYLVLPERFGGLAGRVNEYLLDKQRRGLAEVGVHMHMYYDMVEAMGVAPRAMPFMDDTSPECDGRRELVKGGGYDVPVTAYTEEERGRMLDACVEVFVKSGFGRPRSFCAGYSATDAGLQGMLAERGFVASLAGQTVGPGVYPKCWFSLLEWHRHITPLSVPYRVRRETIVPPEGQDNGGVYWDLVEVPLSMGVDKNELFFGDVVKEREEMFDVHCAWAKKNGAQTAVVIGVHTEVIAGEVPGEGGVYRVIDGFLRHAKARAAREGVALKFVTGSEAAGIFWENKGRGRIDAG